MRVSLRQLLSMHRRLLVLDAAGTEIQVGWVDDARAIWRRVEGEAGVALFRALREVLAAAEVTLSDAEAFVFCDGPGSILGIRTTAIGVRTWNVIAQRPVFAYCSLELLGAAEVRSGRPAPFSVIADARRETWHRIQFPNTTEIGPLERVAPSELTGVLIMPNKFRAWAPLPDKLETVSYDVGELFSRARDVPLLRSTQAPDAFMHEAPAYQTWTPRVHRAPS